MVNRFTEMKFWFNEKHKKLQFCVTSQKRRIQSLERTDHAQLPFDIFKSNGRFSEREVS